MRYAKEYSTKKTPQSEQANPKQKKNSAGGFSFQVDDWARLERFLILGTEGGSYYASQRTLTRDNAKVVERCINLDGVRTVNRIVEISKGGRAPKNDAALFALSMCAKLGDIATRTAAFAAVPDVARIGTHLFTFAENIQAFGGWGRGTKRAFANWYQKRNADQAAYQAVKYRQRNGWTHADVLRLAKPVPVSAKHEALYKYITKGTVADGIAIIEGYEKAKTADTKELCKLIREYGLTREMVPTDQLNNKEVWAALLEKMPLTAMIRNLGNMTRHGLIAPLSDASKVVTACLADTKALQSARVHPIQILAALRTYQSGGGYRSNNTWSPVQQVVDALDGAFYKTFKNVEPTGKNTLLALDVSGSMECGDIAGIPGLTPRVGSAAMALVTAATEANHHFIGFTGGGGWWGGQNSVSNPQNVTELNISPRQRLDTVIKTVSGLPFGSTDCALPMIYAQAKGLQVDTFVVYTDSETWHESIHPHQALEEYRQKTSRIIPVITLQRKD